MSPDEKARAELVATALIMRLVVNEQIALSRDMVRAIFASAGDRPERPSSRDAGDFEAYAKAHFAHLYFTTPTARSRLAGTPEARRAFPPDTLFDALWTEVAAMAEPAT